MTTFPLGRVNVPTAGTPVPLATTPTPCFQIRAQVIAGLTGKMYLGTPGLNKATMAGVVKEFWPNSAGGVDDSWEIRCDESTNGLDLARWAIDAAVSGEGLIITYWQS